MKNQARKAVAPVAAAVAAAAPVIAVGAVVALNFEYLSVTPGATRLQEHDADGTPLVNDEDGAQVGALYLRKAAFGELPVSAKFEVSIKRIA